MVLLVTMLVTTITIVIPYSLSNIQCQFCCWHSVVILHWFGVYADQTSLMYMVLTPEYFFYDN